MSTHDRWLYALDDPTDAWLAVDKEAHLFGAALAVLWLVQWGVRLDVAVLITFGLGLVVEAVELWRWRRLGTVGRVAVITGRRVWPWLCDRVSFKDLAANVGGCALGVGICYVGSLL